MTQITKKNVDEWRNDKMAILKFSANWCGPCTMMKPILEKADAQYKNIQFYEIDIEELPELQTAFKVTSLPTCILVSNGEEVHRMSGMQFAETLQKILDKFQVVVESKSE